MSAGKCSRPVLRWHGGKWRLAPWLIEHMPPHRVYVEPFGGAASVLLRKPRSYAEIYNDLDADVVNLFRVMRGPRAQELVDALRLTPFSRDEFASAYAADSDPVERARRLIVRSFMGFGSSGVYGRSIGFRADSNRSGTTPAADWAHYPDALAAVIERMRGVVIESRSALDVMCAHDRADALHFVDPPYLPETRGATAQGLVKHPYRHEMSKADHMALLEALIGLSGMVMLCGYPSPVYDAHLPGWRRIERAALADDAGKRTEVLWINPAAHEALRGHCGVQQHLPLAEEAWA